MFFHIPGSNGEPKIWPSATTILIKSSQSQATEKKVTQSSLLTGYIWTDAFLRSLSPLLSLFHNSSSALFRASTLFHLTLTVSILNLFFLPDVFDIIQSSVTAKAVLEWDIEILDRSMTPMFAWHEPKETNKVILTYPMCLHVQIYTTYQQRWWSVPCHMGYCVFSAWCAMLRAQLYSESSRGGNGRHIRKWHLFLLCHPPFGSRSEWAIFCRDVAINTSLSSELITSACWDRHARWFGFSPDFPQSCNVKIFHEHT